MGSKRMPLPFREFRGSKGFAELDDFLQRESPTDDDPECQACGSWEAENVCGDCGAPIDAFNPTNIIALFDEGDMTLVADFEEMYLHLPQIARDGAFYQDYADFIRERADLAVREGETFDYDMAVLEWKSMLLTAHHVRFGGDWAPR